MTGPLRERLQPLPVPEHLAPESSCLLAELFGNGDGSLGEPARRALAAAGAAPFLRDLMRRDTERLSEILGNCPFVELERVADRLNDAVFETEGALMAALRHEKQRVALTLALADLGRVMTFYETSRHLSDFADQCLQTALRFCLAEAARQGRHSGDLGACGLAVIAMGKHGAQELNYSSDIDLIVLANPKAAALASSVEAMPFWVRIVQRLVKILQTRTADGYVFRVDLRLRPDPGSTPVAVSLPAALGYYESLGQNWERAALIKARPASGDLDLGTKFLDAITPFVWRKYLDFASISDIASIKRQIHATYGHGELRVAGHDLKRGHGGIREIEFFVQTQQLIAGGRDPALRRRATTDALAALYDAGWIDRSTHDEMGECYHDLRAVEHRIQMLRDEQTHMVPRDAEDRSIVAALTGFYSLDAFDGFLERTLKKVREHYSHLFETVEGADGTKGSLVFTGDDDDLDTVETLAAMGYADPKAIVGMVRSWHYGRYSATRSVVAREHLTTLLPSLLETFAQEGRDRALVSFDAFLKGLPAGVQLFALLAARPQLMTLLARILGSAPALGRVIARRPHIFDALLEPRFFGGLPEREELEEILAQSLALARNEEDLFDRLRIFAAEQRFLIGTRLLAGIIEPQDAGRAFTELAETVIGQAFASVRKSFESRHGVLPEGRFVVLAMGRLGAGAMTASSDLDLILLYDHAGDSTASDGADPLPPSLYANRLTRRLIAALSAPTGQGLAYAVDLRLRPSGRAGPLATLLASFARYQEKDAWTWERLALTRARPIAGDSSLIEETGAVIAQVIGHPREAATILSDVAEMRTRVRQEKGSDDLWNLKLVGGGLMDIDFVGQALMLIDGKVSRDDIVGALEAAPIEVLSAEDREALVKAWQLQTALLQGLRVAAEDDLQVSEAPESLKAFLAELAGLPSFPVLEADLAAIQKRAGEAVERFLEISK